MSDAILLNEIVVYSHDSQQAAMPRYDLAISEIQRNPLFNPTSNMRPNCSYDSTFRKGTCWKPRPWSHLPALGKDSTVLISSHKRLSIATNSRCTMTIPHCPATDLSFFKKAAALPDGPARILALAEAWCGDVYRELPTVACIAEATGMDLRVFLRGENPDIMDEFLSNEGKARAIPVFIFYTKETRYITHLTKRSAGAYTELAAIMDQVKSQLNLPPATTFATVPETNRQAFIREVTRITRASSLSRTTSLISRSHI